MARRIKSYSDCLRTLNWLYNELMAGRIQKEKAHQLRLHVMSILDVIKTRDIEKLEEESKRMDEFEDDWCE
ncbi:MAG: hypothetical protein Q7O12_05665 [Deltaproteobacteria bacterium]|nr:hypothetical protein [Deltaproteobacteria bacterium]